MSIFWASLFVTLFGNLQARQTNTDDNRLHVITGALNSGNSDYRGPFLETNRIYKENDYDDYSSGVAEPSASSQSWYTAPPHTHAKTPIKVYKPREDPRLFYQSDDYLKEINSQNINYEVASIYPGREVVRFGELDDDVLATPSIRRLRSRDDNRIDLPESQHCVNCPRDRTVLAKAGSDRVILQSPRLSLCSGRKAPKSFHFGSLDGPKIGSLLEEGTYTIIGRIMHWNENLQICKFNVHVVTQRCRTPKSLVAHCRGLYEPCYFTCRDSKMEIHGAPSLTCGDDFQWNGNLPVCRVRHWCKRPSPPDHGRISCVGNSTGEMSEGLAEGSRCRVRCSLGFHSNPRIVAFCHRGTWNRSLKCQPNKNT